MLPDQDPHGFWEGFQTWPIWGFFAVIGGALMRFMSMAKARKDTHHEGPTNSDVIGLIRQLLESSARTERRIDDVKNQVDAGFDRLGERISVLEGQRAA